MKPPVLQSSKLVREEICWPVDGLSILFRVLLLLAIVTSLGTGSKGSPALLSMQGLSHVRLLFR